MPTTINVTLKEGGDVAQLEKAKSDLTDKGGKIIKQFQLIKGFTAEIPDDAVSALSTNEHYDVEKDGVVTTQG